MYGAPGTDFAMASLLPRHFLAIYDHAVVQPDLAKAQAAHNRLVPLFRLMERYNVTRLAKAVAPMVGLDLGPHRTPLLPLPAEQTAEIRAVIEELEDS